MMTFARQLRTLRDRAGLTQVELAQRSGCPVRTIQSWEAGHRQPALAMAAKLARALGCTLDELAGARPAQR